MNDSNEIFSTPKVVVVIVDTEKAQGIIEQLCNGYASVIYKFRVSEPATLAASAPGPAVAPDSGRACKTVIISVAPDYQVKQLLHKLQRELSSDSYRGSIVFSIPISGVAGRARAMLINDIDTSTDYGNGNEVNVVKNENEYDLIVVAAKCGYSEEIVEVAKHAGATGGTAWIAEKIDIEDTVKVVDVTSQNEQEILAMLIKRNKKRDIMMVVNEKFGIESEAQGMVLSLPVDSVQGLGRDT